MRDQLCRPLDRAFMESSRKLASWPWCKSATKKTWNGLVYVQSVELYCSLIRITRSCGKSDNYFLIFNIFERQKENFPPKLKEKYEFCSYTQCWRKQGMFYGIMQIYKYILFYSAGALLTDESYAENTICLSWIFSIFLAVEKMVEHFYTELRKGRVCPVKCNPVDIDGTYFGDTHLLCPSNSKSDCQNYTLKIRRAETLS